MNFLKNPIFNGITEEEYNELAAPGCTRTSRYAKDQAVFCTGDQTTAFGILLSGELHIENIDLTASSSTTFPQGKPSPRPTPSAASR